MSETRRIFYFLYRNNRAKQVTKDEWEADWLRWWKKQTRKNMV